MHNSDFQSLFLCGKSAESLKKELLKNTKIGDKLLLIQYFDNFDFQCTLFSKNQCAQILMFHTKSSQIAI